MLAGVVDVFTLVGAPAVACLQACDRKIEKLQLESQLLAARNN